MVATECPSLSFCNPVICALAYLFPFMSYTVGATYLDHTFIHPHPLKGVSSFFHTIPFILGHGSS